MKKRIVILAAIIIAIIVATAVAKTTTNQKADNRSIKTTTAADTKEKTTTEAVGSSAEQGTTEGKTEQTTQEIVPASIEENTDQEFDTEATTAEVRETEETKELFRIALAFIEEYDLNSDDFTITKAFMAQDLSHDYLYFVCKHDGKTEYACYTYDGNYFRDDISQKKLKKEYEEAIATADNDENGNAYYTYTKQDIHSVNEMF
jgi:hypothetical protein